MTTSPDHGFGMPGYTSSTYGEAFADVYDDWYAELDDADFVESVVKMLPQSPVRVLELGVGTGRLLAQFMALRHNTNDELIGIDSSAEMLRNAKERTWATPVQLVQGDFSESLPEGPFDVVFVGYNTLFNLPDSQAVENCLALVASRLSPHGMLHIDVVSPRAEDPSDHVGVRTISTGEVVLSVSRHDPHDQRITGQFIQFTNGEKVRLRPWAVRYVTTDQLDALAQQVGLTLASRTADGHGTPYAVGSRRHISRYVPTASA
jgi:trans-aconitate methyltransferase